MLIVDVALGRRRRRVVVGDRPGHLVIAPFFGPLEQRLEALAAENLERELRWVTLTDVLDDVNVEVRIAAGLVDLARLGPQP